MKNLLRLQDLSIEEINNILDLAQSIKDKKISPLVENKIIANLFFEPSTRTHYSFATAEARLGCKTIDFSPNSSSMKKGETFYDTIKTFESFGVDGLVIRDAKNQWYKELINKIKVPIINAGDGAHMHPSQCLLDLYSIYKTQGTLEDLNIYLVGDLKYGRTVHSLITAMRHFNPTFHFIAPKELAMPQEYKLYCKEHNIRYQEHTAFNEKVIADADILYMTRVQKERFSDLMEYEKVKNIYILNRDMLKYAKENMRILHPLPRVNEIAYDVDDDPHAYYIQQAKNGLYAREAIFCHCLGITLDDIKNDKTIIE